MFRSVSLKFTEVTAPITIDGQGITIFVGPNNSGKSLALKELEIYCSSSPKPANLHIIQDVEIIWPSEAEIEAEIERLEKRRPLGLGANLIHIGRFTGGGLDSTNVNRDTLFQIAKAATNTSWLLSQFLRFLLIRLDGRTRFELTDDRPTGDLLGQPQNALAHLFQDDDLRKQVRTLLYDAFGVYFVIDPLMGGNLRIRLSKAAPHADEQSLNKNAREFHRAATYIKEASDGVQAYVGIITAVLSGEFRAILIDEPEAFLHPPLARKLGKQLAALATKRKGSLFASTPSADFLMGCIQASPSVRVVRLEYSDGKSKGKSIDPKALENIYRTPLMRSANVISWLFHDGVVVTESDNDRAFYSEIYHRLSETEEGYPSILFVNAQNKQTAKDIVAPLRQFGIPAAAIVDIDVLKDGGAVWTDWLKSAHIPDALHSGYASQRDALKKLFEGSGKDMKRDGGVAILSNDDQNAANLLFDTLEQYGVFVVRRGELENWLPNLGAVGKKTDWVVSILEKMGSDPNATEYVKPGKGDVWDFMRKVAAWIKDSSRKGTA